MLKTSPRRDRWSQFSTRFLTPICNFLGFSSPYVKWFPRTKNSDIRANNFIWKERKVEENEVTSLLLLTFAEEKKKPVEQLKKPQELQKTFGSNHYYSSSPKTMRVV